MRRALLLLALASCAHREPIRTDAPATPRPGRELAAESRAPREVGPQVGLATWYGAELAGHKTASGERFDPSGLTAAHRTLPIGTWVDVRRRDNGKSVRVRINDRGPFGHKERIIDLSRGAAERIDMVRSGVVEVELRVAGY